MRNASIRLKLLIYMIINIVLFTFLLIGSNTFFAEKYYISNKKSTLIESAQKLEQLLQDKNDEYDFSDEELSYSINTIEKSIGGTVYIGTRDGELLYPVKNLRQKLGASVFYNTDTDKKLTPKIKEFIKVKEKKGLERYDDRSLFYIIKDPSFKIETLRFQRRLDNGLFILVWVPMEGISESAKLSNQFTVIVALITLLITGGWAFFISGKFTRPISDINKITRKMSNLDFSETLKVDRTDEIGQLSESINQLSYSLDEAIFELNDKNKKLEHDIDREKSLDKMRREFVSNVSHELKTPIFLIQGYAEGLKSNIADDTNKRNFYCDVIMEESDKMDILVKELLDLSKLEAGMYSISRESFSIPVMIHDIILRYSHIFKDKCIDIDLNIEENLEAFADPVRIEQVIVNFVNNAIDHVDSRKKIRLTAALINDKIKVSFYNSGQHIPEESIDKIWTSFYKVDKARTREFGGTGLGLSIVRAIQEAHKCGYGVNNTESGVEFWFEVDKGNAP
jgi:signal transduction histidine kinase